MSWHGRPLGAGFAPVAAVDATASFVPIPKAASGFYVHASAAAWIDVRNNSTADSLSAADASALAAGVLYGPFSVMRGNDTHIAVAGNGGASTVTITFVV